MRQKQEGSGCRAECRPFLRHLAGLTPVLRHMNKNMPGILGLLLSVLHSPGRLLRGNGKRVFPNEEAAISWSFVPRVCKPKQHLGLTQMARQAPLLLRAQPGRDTGSLDGAKRQSQLPLRLDLEGTRNVKSFEAGIAKCGLSSFSFRFRCEKEIGAPVPHKIAGSSPSQSPWA